MCFGRRGGFTLIELMIVIAILIILAVALIGGFAWAKDRAANTATKQMMDGISTAIETHRSQMGYYPGYKYAVPTDDIEGLFDAIYYGPEEFARFGKENEIGTPRGPLIKLDRKWIKRKGNLKRKVKEADLEDPESNLLIVDAWGNPLHYIEYLSKEPAARKAAVNIGGYAHKARNKTSFDIFSAGKDGEPGTPDDVW